MILIMLFVGIASVLIGSVFTAKATSKKNRKIYI